MKKAKTLRLTALLLLMAALPALAAIPPPPKEIAEVRGFAELDEATMKRLFEEGTLIIVRHRPDMTLVNVTAGQLVNAPIDAVWSVLTDFENYPKFMPQTAAQRVVSREGDRRLVVEQKVSVQIWRLPAIETTYLLAQELSPPDKMRFWHVSGQLQGTYGGWDLIETQEQTMIFYTLYSNLTTLPFGLGAVMASQPDFMTAVNVSTALMVVKAVKEECERRAGN